MRLVVYDVLGRPVRTLVDAVQPAGTYVASWDGDDDAGRGVAAGVYIARLEGADVVQSRKMVRVDGEGRSAPPAPVPSAAKFGVRGREETDLYTVTIVGDDIEPFTRTGIFIGADTTLDFEVVRIRGMPFALEPWRYHQTIRVAEQAGIAALQFPVVLELNTKQLVEAGDMRADGADVRLTLAGEEIPFQLEKMRTERTQITFQVDLVPGQIRTDAVLHYGNPKAEAPLYDTDWGKIRPGRYGFENELLRVAYGLKPGADGVMRACQTVFAIKKYDEDQFGGERIPDSWAKSRNDVTYWEPDEGVPPTFAVEVEGPIYKRVRFFSGWKRVDGGRRVTNLSQRVTFYRGSPFIKEEYDKILGPVVDTAVPGGMRLRDGGRNFDFVAHNFDSALVTWEGLGEDREARGGWDANKTRAQKDPRRRYLGDSLYNGFLILGVVNIHNGRGIGTCAMDVQTADFIDWPHEQAGWSLQPSQFRRRLTRFLYYVEQGREEVVARGKLLADPPLASLDVDSSADWGRVHVGRDPESLW